MNQDIKVQMEAQAIDIYVKITEQLQKDLEMINLQGDNEDQLNIFQDNGLLVALQRIGVAQTDLDKLKGGDLAESVDFKSQIDSINLEIKKLESKFSNLKEPDEFLIKSKVETLLDSDMGSPDKMLKEFDLNDIKVECEERSEEDEAMAKQNVSIAIEDRDNIDEYNMEHSEYDEELNIEYDDEIDVNLPANPDEIQNQEEVKSGNNDLTSSVGPQDKSILTMKQILSESILAM